MLGIRHAIGVILGLFVAAGMKVVGLDAGIIVLVTLFVVLFVWNVSSWVPLIGALLSFSAFLALPFMGNGIVKDTDAALEKLIIAAFYFCAVTVVLFIRRYLRPPKQKPYIVERQTDAEDNTGVMAEEIEQLVHEQPSEPKTKTMPIHAHKPAPVVAKKPLVPSPLRKTAPLKTTLKPVAPTAPKAISIAPIVVPPAKDIPMPHMQRSPYLLDLRAKKAPLAAQTSPQQQPKKQISDVAPVPLFKAKAQRPAGKIQL